QRTKSPSWLRITEKHPAIWQTLFRRYTQPAEGAAESRLIVELFSGTGSGALAVLRSISAKYRWIGVEIDAACQKEAEWRLHKEFTKWKQQIQQNPVLQISQLEQYQR